MSDATMRAEAEQYLALDPSELYTLMVPERVREEEVFSREGLVARGKAAFATALREGRTTVCAQYGTRGASVRNAIDLVVLVAGALVAVPALAGIPALPMAALIVKIGLEELCRESEGTGEE
jgi:hypothetical protein